MHPPLSRALFGSSESSLLVTLSDRHHLDRPEFMWVARVDLVSGFWAIHRDGVSKNQPVESTWSLRGSRGSKTLARVLQRGQVESGDSDTSAKHHRALSSTTPLHSSIYFVFLHS